MRPRGYSMPELLVAMALLAGIFSMFMQLVVPALRVWSRNRARADLEQSGLILQRRLEAEMLESNRDSLTVLSADPPAIAFLALEPAGYHPDTGEPLWGGFVAYCLDTENRVLYRKEWPSGGASQTPALPYSFPTTETLRMTEAELRDLCTTENGTEEVAAYHVASMEVAAPTGDPLALTLGFGTGSSAGDEETERRLELETRN